MSQCLLLVLCPWNMVQLTTPIALDRDLRLADMLPALLTHLHLDGDQGGDETAVHYWIITEKGRSTLAIPRDLTVAECHKRGWMIGYRMGKMHQQDCFLCQSLQDCLGHSLSKNQKKRRADPAIMPGSTETLATDGTPVAVDDSIHSTDVRPIVETHLDAPQSQAGTSGSEDTTSVKEDFKAFRALVEPLLLELVTDVKKLKTDVAELKTDVAELKKDMSNVKKDVAGLKADVAGLKTDMAAVQGKADRLTENSDALQRVVSGIVESLASGAFFRNVQQKFNPATIHAPVRLGKLFSSMGTASPLTDSYRKVLPLLPECPEGSQQTDWTQADPRLSAKTKAVEVDLFVKFVWLNDRQIGLASTAVYSSPPSSQASSPVSPAVLSTPWRSTSPPFTGCAVGEVTRADLVPRAVRNPKENDQVDHKDPQYLKLLFKFAQLERAVIAVERYYVPKTEDQSRLHPVEFASLSSPSFASLDPWKKRSLINMVFSHVDSEYSDALVNLKRLHEQDALLLL